MDKQWSYEFLKYQLQTVLNVKNNRLPRLLYLKINPLLQFLDNVLDVTLFESNSLSKSNSTRFRQYSHLVDVRESYLYPTDPGGDCDPLQSSLHCHNLHKLC